MPPSREALEAVTGRALTEEQLALLLSLDVAVMPGELALPPHRHGETARRRVRTALESFIIDEPVTSPMVYAVRQMLAGLG